MLKTKIANILSLRRIVAAAALFILIIASGSHPLAAQTVTQGYNSDQPLQRGMMVKLKKDDPGKIEPVTTDNMDQMHGIVVDANDAPVTVSAEGHKTFVATSGHFDVLVTNQNGPITIGDYISVSSLPGIGMKADDKQGIVIGKALAVFDGNNNTIGKLDLKESDGSTRGVSIGRVLVDISIAGNPNVRPTDTNLPGFLKKAVEAIADKPVSAARVYLTLGIFLATSIIAGTILYAGVRSSFIAVGRNPLSKKTIMRSLVQVILTSLIIFTSGIFGVYLLLKL